MSDSNDFLRAARNKMGRPPKFLEPRRPITVTLPEGTLARLASVDADRARAIVKVTEAAMPDFKTQKQVELVEVAAGLGIIVIGPSKLLQRIIWLKLVEVAPLRFLLTIPPGSSVDSLELAIVDLLDEVAPHDEWELSLLSELRDLIRKLRRRGGLSKAEMLFIDTRALDDSAESEPPVKQSSASSR
jgi:hypothetical protein